MTRAQRIALRMRRAPRVRIPYATWHESDGTPTPFTSEAARVVADSSVYWMSTHGCYEAMDEPDATDVAPRIITGGNSGMLCA